MNQLLLYARTIRTLLLSQIAYFALRRIFPPSKSIQLKEPILLRAKIHMNPNFPCAQKTGTHYEFFFLNRKKTFLDRKIDWSCQDMPKLWRYNLHYFDYLHDQNRSFLNKSELISSWITNNSIGKEDAWEPYTLSIRIVNWIKFFMLEETIPKKVWLESLWCQALWLEGNIEYHLRANHLLKNGVALFFAGLFFEGPEPERWKKKGLDILTEAFREQFLPDGGHYERSPMYHSICVIDYLDVLNILKNSQTSLCKEQIPNFTDGLILALNFLHDICLPDNEIPLFNDSAFGIAPSPHSIFDYASHVIGYKKPKAKIGNFSIEKTSSGFFIIGKDNDMMIIDCGQIGPDYQPGHAHCDTLSYELSINGSRVIVDSGVYDYELSPTRLYARSTKAHNTVSVDEVEQSEVWGVFRVARRAKPVQANLVTNGEGHIIFQGAHTGYVRLPGQVMHHRQIVYDGQFTWQISDQVQGRCFHSIESYIHLHPTYSANVENGSVRVMDSTGALTLRIETSHTNNIRLEKSWYFPEFGVKKENIVLIFSRSGELPLSIDYIITNEVQAKLDDESAGIFSSSISNSQVSQ